MQIDPRLGTFEGVVAQAEPHRATLEALRAVVSDLQPEAVEVASDRERSVWWGIGPGKMTHGYAYVMPHKAHVNLGFFQGVSLPDPAGLLSGTGKALRHVKITSPEAAGRSEVVDLIRAARSERERQHGQ